MSETNVVRFEKTAKQSANEKRIALVIAVIVGFAFAAVLAFVPELPVIVMVVCVGAIGIAVLLVWKLLKEIKDILAADESWVVTVTDQTLTWFSPVPDEMKSFETPLDRIDHVEYRRTRFKNSKRTPKKEFFIHFKGGESLSLDPQNSGIYPEKVFNELKARAVQYEHTTATAGSNVNVTVS